MRRDAEGPDKELTGPHRQVIAAIREMGLEVVAEYPVGSYRIDCYLPEFHAGIEVDGPTHWKKRDAKRDGIIWDVYQIPILRIAEEVIRQVPEELPRIVAHYLTPFEGTVAQRKAHAKRTEERRAKWPTTKTPA